jgi:glycosyltransferase involved in cell wall biosynthesis
MNADLRAPTVEARRNGRPTVAHFGTYGELVVQVLEPALLSLLRRNPELDVLLIGRGSMRFAESIRAKFPERAGNVRATGELDAAEVGCLLRDCDVALFPFGDGVSTRRTSLMSALAMGAAIVTTEGWCSESIWRSSDAVELCDPEEPSSVVRGAERLLHDPARRGALRRRARELYEQRFHVDRVVARLQELNGEISARNDRP